MNKSSLRKLYLEKRNRLSAKDVYQQSRMIADTFFEKFDLSSAKNLHIFLSIPQKKEPDTSIIIIEQLRQDYPSVQIITSKTNFGKMEMESFVLKPETKIILNRWGVPEPVEAESFVEEKIDWVVVPLLCFDKKGYRVGYGKGFYDRFLKKCKNDVLKIGLSFFEPVEEIEDLNEDDIPLNYCIVNSSLYVF